MSGYGVRKIPDTQADRIEYGEGAESATRTFFRIEFFVDPATAEIRIAVLVDVDEPIFSRAMRDAVKSTAADTIDSAADIVYALQFVLDGEQANNVTQNTLTESSPIE